MRDVAQQLALILAPHPDDESLGCGGTIRLISEGGGTVDVLYMTRGERGAFPLPPATEAARRELALRREAEARAACERLGVRRVAFLAGEDGNLTATAHQVSDPILAALHEGAYRSVFCPWPFDGHRDHQATYRALHSALGRTSRTIDVWLYEVWTPLSSPNFHVAIDETLEVKMHAFSAHESQSAALPYEQAFRGLARYRALASPPATAAEAFYYCSSRELLRHERLPWPKSPWM